MLYSEEMRTSDDICRQFGGGEAVDQLVVSYLPDGLGRTREVCPLPLHLRQLSQPAINIVMAPEPVLAALYADSIPCRSHSSSFPVP